MRDRSGWRNSEIICCCCHSSRKLPCREWVDINVESEAREFRQALQTGGSKGYWQKNLELTLKEYQEAGARYFPALVVAAAYARVGDRQKAMDWLEKTYTERDGNLTLVKSYPDFKGLGGDPRFVNLLKRIGLPE